MGGWLLRPTYNPVLEGEGRDFSVAKSVGRLDLDPQGSDVHPQWGGV